MTAGTLPADAVEPSGWTAAHLALYGFMLVGLAVVFYIGWLSHRWACRHCDAREIRKVQAGAGTRDERSAERAYFEGIRQAPDFMTMNGPRHRAPEFDLENATREVRSHRMTG